MKKLGLLAIAALALTGCSSPATAVVVNGTEITERQIDRISEGCSTVYANTANDLRRDVVNNMLLGELGASVARANGVQITEAERLQFLQTTTAGQTMLGDDECAKMADGLAMYLLAMDRVGQEAFVAAAQEVEVTLNPRYGVWDSAQGSVAGTGSLSELAPNSE